MKKLLYIILLVFLFSCNSENAGDCFRTSGSIIQQEVALDVFDKILVNRDIELIIEEGITRITSYNVCYTKLLRARWCHGYHASALQIY